MGSDESEGQASGQDPATSGDACGALSRRGFLIGAGAVTGVAALDAAVYAARGGVVGNLPKTIAAAEALGDYRLRTKSTFTVLIRRREDFLFLQVDGYNLVRQAAPHARKAGPVSQSLVRKAAGHDAFLVFSHLPQHLAEQAFIEQDQPTKKSPNPPATDLEPGKAESRLAFPTRLAFRIPSNVHTIPYTLEALLGWELFQPSLAPVAAFGGGLVALRAKSTSPPTKAPAPKKPSPGRLVAKKAPKLRAPAATETAIELPWHVALSPLLNGRWSHPTAVRTLGGWTELWHTRLSAAPGPLAPDGAPIRAIWNYDLGTNKKDATTYRKPTLNGEQPPADSAAPFLMSMDARDRYQVVRASSDFTIVGRADVQAHKLWLSSRGGFLDSLADWDLSLTATANKKAALDIEEWKHQATLGRDQYVKVVTKGFLFPFGHGAVLTKITERHFEAVAGEIVATFRQRTFIVVRQPFKSYVPADTYGIANDSRDLPFRDLRITTLRTPNLDSPPTPVSGYASLISAGGVGFPFHFVGTDWAGRQVEFTAPAVFVHENDGFDTSHSAAIRDAYNVLASGNVGTFQGTAVAFAVAGKPGDTDLTTLSMTFGAGAGTGGSEDAFRSHDQPQTYPTIRSATVRLSAAEQAAGAGGSPLEATVSYNAIYVGPPAGPAPGGFDPGTNPGKIFMDVQGSGPTVEFGGGSSGGVMTPNLQIKGLSRSLGPVAGKPGDIAKGKFIVEDVFAAVDAKILGGVSLKSILELISDFGGGDAEPSDNALRITYDRSGTAITTHLKWTPDVSGNDVIVMDTSPPGSFELDGLITTDVANPDASTFQVNGDLKGFTVNLIGQGVAGFIAIPVHELTFVSAKGQKSHVHVDLGDVQFLGVLEFVEKLEEYLDFSGDGGPKIQVLPTGISADLAVPIPDIGVGILSLTNIAIDVGFNLPFDGSPARFRFSFSTRDNPFGLSVAIFGGGGFFGIAIGTDGVELIEASLDFGAMCAINLGIASGSVHLLAGIYFSYGDNGSGTDMVVLSGFVKLGGQLSILGLITLSLEFDMSLTYETPPSAVTGTATLAVGVSVLFFSFSVSVTASKTFGGGAKAAELNGVVIQGVAGALTFEDQVTAGDWNVYCDAFAQN